MCKRDIMARSSIILIGIAVLFPINTQYTENLKPLAEIQREFWDMWKHNRLNRNSDRICKAEWRRLTTLNAKERFALCLWYDIKNNSSRYLNLPNITKIPTQIPNETRDVFFKAEKGDPLFEKVVKTPQIDCPMDQLEFDTSDAIVTKGTKPSYFRLTLKSPNCLISLIPVPPFPVPVLNINSNIAHRIRYVRWHQSYIQSEVCSEKDSIEKIIHDLTRLSPEQMQKKLLAEVSTILNAAKETNKRKRGHDAESSGNKNAKKD